jgi:hypothetical protein
MAAMGCMQVDYQGWQAVRIESAAATLVAIPELGGKIVSIVARTTGTELLWQDETRPYRALRYGDRFGDYDASGFDECFPTIGECIYPEQPWLGDTVPDHGELWCRPWRYEVSTEAVTMCAHGTRFPYRFERTVAPDAQTGGFSLRYAVTSLTPFPFQYLWSAHPLFAAVEDMRVLIPGEPEGMVAFHAGERIGGTPLQPFTWPWAPGPGGSPVDYRIIGPRNRNANDKVCLRTPAEGWCGLYRPDTGDFAGFRLNPEDVPYVAVCVNQGAYPPSGRGAYWVALEPCTGYPDPLDEAVANGSAITLAQNGVREWALDLVIGQANSAEQAAERLGGARKKK